MDIEEVFENLSVFTAEELIRIADSSGVLLQASSDDLIYLAQELAGRLEDVLNIRIDYTADDEEENYRLVEHSTEYNN